MKDLTAREVFAIRKPGKHRVSRQLYLQLTETDARSWLFRYERNGVAHWHGLGSCDLVTLAEARDAAIECRKLLRSGLDPIEEKKTAKANLIARQTATITFHEAAQKVAAFKATEFKNAKHARQWPSTLETYAFPVIGKLPVADVALEHVVSVLEPHWLDKTETMKRLRGRLEKVLAWATVSGYRTGDNPARWKGNLDAVLPQPGKVAKVKHFERVPIDDIGAFMQQLRQRDGMAARSVEYQILTATWSAAVRFARWGEIDFERKVWTIPGVRLLKRGEMAQFRVPLSDDAIALLRGLEQGDEDQLLFFAPRGGALSDMSLSAVMRRMGLTATVHGTARSTFKDWAVERTSYDNIVSEAALAHVNGCKVEQSYRRGDLFERRRKLMNAWAKFCASLPRAKGEVVELAARR
jgi:Arm DNA-binding domain